MDKNGYQLGLIELTGVYVTPCTKQQLEEGSKKMRMPVGRYLGWLIDRAEVRTVAETFIWSKGKRQG